MVTNSIKRRHSHPYYLSLAKYLKNICNIESVLYKNKLINNNQFEFCPNYATEHALYHFNKNYQKKPLDNDI